MTDEEREHLAETLRIARARKDLTAREVARRAGVDVGTVRLLERQRIAQPRIDSVRAIAQVLDISLADLYATLHWMPADELPALRPYMRARYGELSDDDLTRVEAFVAELTTRPTAGPSAHEDEQ